MSAIETFSFSGFTLRPATLSDRQLAETWTLADPFHKQVSPEFWIEQKLGRDSYLLSDQRGGVFFFKLIRLTDRKVEFHIQFMPDTEPEARSRTRRGLVEGFVWIERVLLTNAIEEVTFDSNNPELMAFCRKRLGFTVESGRLWKTLNPATAAAE